MVRVFLDLDGVLVNFAKGIKDKYNLEYPTTRIPNNEFESFHEDLFGRIRKEGVNFWKSLELMPGALDMFKFFEAEVKELNILTAWPHSFNNRSDQLSAALGKKFWVEENLGTRMAMRTIVCFAKDKHHNVNRFPNDTNILIDDMPGNIEKWESVGGIGILHKSPEQTISEFKMRILQ
jgi:hypothetical protein